MTLASGARLGPYEVLAPLGAGGMGEVYRARDTKLKRNVAIKVLPEALSRDADALARFEREALAVAALSHPNILSIFDFGDQEGRKYAVMELLDGETLRDALASGPLPPRKILAFARAIAEGLAAAHEKGIVHRDLKPENVFVATDGHVKILDFGLAKWTSAPGDDASSAPTEGAGTEPGTVMGTAGYMSPEQVRGKVVDHRSDIFSFGAILYEMLAGRRAFRGASAADTMAAILKEDPPDLPSGASGIAPGFERIVRHCLEKRPEQRFQSARDLAFDLESLSSVSSPVAGREGAGGRRGIRRALLVAVAGLLVLAATAAYVVGRAEGRRTPPGIHYRQLTLRRQTIFSARFTPDGRTIVFSAALEGNRPELFTVRADFPDPKPLGFGGVHLLSVSSKGELAVLTDARNVGGDNFRGRLARMPLEGGAPREILEMAREADWSPDGSGLGVIRDFDGRDRLEFPIGKVLCETGGGLSDIRFSPRGDRIAFFEHDYVLGDKGSVAVVDLSGRKSVLSRVYTQLEGLAWTTDGEEVLFSASDPSGGVAVHAVTLSGRTRVVLESPARLLIRDVHGDGRWLVAREDRVTEMPVLAPGQTVERNLAWLDRSFPVALSSDGRTLVFGEGNGSAGTLHAVCLRGTDGSPVVRLGDGDPEDVSPDGKWVLATVPTSPQQLVLYPTGAGEARRLDRGPLEAYEGARFFPDGKSVLVCGHEAGHAGRCYVQALSGGSPRPVTPEGTAECVVSQDSLSILAALPGSRFVIYPVEGGEGKPVPGTKGMDQKIGWSRDSRSMLVWKFGGIPARIERLDIATGRREFVRTVGPADLSGVIELGSFLFSADEKSYAYSVSRMSSTLFLAEKAR